MIDVIKAIVKNILGKDEYVIQNYENYGIKAINKKKLDVKISQLKKASLTTTKRNPEVIINLTSFPQRMYDIHYTLYSLLTQSLSPDRVILWLSVEEFPNKLNDIPATVKKFLFMGLEIEWIEGNVRAYNKLIPALKKYPKAIHITADDDVYYKNDWLMRLYGDYQIHGDQYIYANRAHRIRYKNTQLASYDEWEKEIRNVDASYFNFATGVGGILYPVDGLHTDVLKKDLFTVLSPSNDDIWFWGMSVLNNKKIKVVDGFNGLIFINPERELRLNGEFTLSEENVVGQNNDIQLQNILKHYPILEKLLNEKKENY